MASEEMGLRTIFDIASVQAEKLNCREGLLKWKRNP